MPYATYFYLQIDYHSMVNSFKSEYALKIILVLHAERVRASKFSILEVRELGGVTQTCMKARNLFWPA